MPSDDIAISVRHLTKTYRLFGHPGDRVKQFLSLGLKQYHHDFTALRDVSFDIKKGETVGIIGRNGSGKSTLLQLICGILKPTAGTVQVNGRVSALLELGAGFNPEFTGRENVYFQGALMGLTNAQINERFDGIAEFADIGEFIDQEVRTYSSGMHLRLAFAVASAIQPDVLIVDEAFSVGDAHFQAKCFQRLNEFKQQGTTLILVSHNPNDIVKHCERAVMLKGGRIEQDGSSRAVTNYYLDALYGKQRTSDLAPQHVEVATEKVIASGLSDKFNARPSYHQGEHRWGHGGAAILDYLIVAEGVAYPLVIKGDSTVHFYFNIRFDANFDNVVPGFLIKTLEGAPIYGTNSLLSSQGQEEISVCSGDVKVFRFSMPLRLNEGHYLVSFGISSGKSPQDLTPLDRRYDSVLVHVRNTQSFVGIADLAALFHSESMPMMHANTAPNDFTSRI